jgi:hypothetical protein
MTTFTSEDREQVMLDALTKISNQHFKELHQCFDRHGMTQEQIDNMAFNLNLPYDITKIVRAVEKWHGIV